MQDALLSELRADMELARRVRDGARRRVSAVTRDLKNLDEEINSLETAAQVAQKSHDQMQRLAARSFVKGDYAKGHQKVCRRNECGEQVRAARAERDQLIAQKQSILNQAEALRNLLEVPRLNERFVIARHWLLRARADLEVFDAEVQALKATYVQLAQIPAPFANDLGLVWYYDERDERGEVTEVHLFYGGTVAPTSEGTSPDGDGHGHHVLVRKNGILGLGFHRLP